MTGGSPTARPPGFEQDFDDYYASLEYLGETIVARLEYREFEADPTPIFGSFTITPWYAQLGWHISPMFRIYAQAEFDSAEQDRSDFPILTRGYDVDLREDYGLALNVVFSPNVVLKLEHHWVEQEQFTLVPTAPPPLLQLDHTIIPVEDGNYTILSLSASF